MEAWAVAAAMFIVSAVCVFIAQRFFRKPEFGALAAAITIGGTYLIAPDRFLSISWQVFNLTVAVGYILVGIFVVTLFYAICSGRRVRDCLPGVHKLIGD